MTSTPNETDLAHYATAVRGLLARGGYELSGRPAQAARWEITHVRDYLDAHGAPDARPTVHVAGSKAKGSIATMTEALIRASLPATPGSARTMLYTSPDLHAARERITLDGEAIGAATFATLAGQVLADPGTEGWSYFELLTLMAWQAAADAGCRWQVLEVGLGGRLDTTNAIAEKAVAVIAPTDLEHTAILGETIQEIAAEKAGILTGPCDLVVAPQRASALDVIRAAAEAAGARLHEIAAECGLEVTSQSLDQLQFDVQTPERKYRQIKLQLLGQHQAENALAAIRAAELALATEEIELDEQTVRQALAGVRLPGRGEVIGRQPLTIVDGAHTPLAAKRLRQALDQTGVPKARVFVFGLLDGKDVEPIARALFGPDDQAMIAPPASPRAADTAAVAEVVRALGVPVSTAPDVATALDRATITAGERGAVIATGSLRTVAEVREARLVITGDRALGLR
jgi:dihydrofolate synthase/folylpolyglutamate synthase